MHRRIVQHVVFRGPPLGPGNGLTFSEDGMTFSGHVGAHAASGSVRGQVDGCTVGSGATWRAST